MVDTGIIRRIDDLGRVVIPKEIRKTLRIKEGDPLEIYTNKEELVFKKYSPVVSVLENAKIYASLLAGICEKICIVTDTDSVVYSSDPKLKESEGKRISERLEKIISGKKSLLLCSGEGGEIAEITHGDTFDAENQIIVPIADGENGYGALILFDRDKEKRFDSKDVKIVSLCAEYIKNKL